MCVLRISSQKEETEQKFQLTDKLQVNLGVKKMHAFFFSSKGTFQRIYYDV